MDKRYQVRVSPEALCRVFKQALYPYGLCSLRHRDYQPYNEHNLDISFAYWEIFILLLSSVDFFQNLSPSPKKNYFRKTIRLPKSLGPDQDRRSGCKLFAKVYTKVAVSKERVKQQFQQNLHSVLWKHII